MSIKDGIIGAIMVGGSGGGGGGSVVVPNIQATATTLPAGSDATVTRMGSNTNPVFAFGIPAGQKGEPGAAGAPGAQGPQGLQGPAGAPGAAGAVGPKGEQGVAGPAGTEGIQGPPGPAGTDGKAGPEGPQGAQGIQGEKGEPGDPFLIQKVYATKADMDAGYASDGLKEGQLVGISTATGGTDGGHLYIKGAEAYEFFFDLGSVDGIAGPQGPQGEQGPTGPAGETGPQGPAGPKGETGAQGPQGPAGPAGAEGAQGPAGKDGAQGPVGPQGEQGVQGEQGPPGPKGDKGDPGPQGPPGSGTDLTAGDGVSIEDETINLTTPVQGIFTQTEFDALPQDKQNKGLYVIPDAGGGSGGEVYSTEETRIGTWIDGKPIYRIVVHLGNSTTYSVENLNVASLVRLQGVALVSVWDSRIPIPFVTQASNISLDITGSNLRILANGEIASVTKDIIAVIEYTKTTDPAQTQEVSNT